MASARRPPSARSISTATSWFPKPPSLAQTAHRRQPNPAGNFRGRSNQRINAQQEKDVSEVMTTIDRRLFDSGQKGIDIQVVAACPGQSIIRSPQRSRKPPSPRQCGVGWNILLAQAPPVRRARRRKHCKSGDAVRELDYIMNDLKLKGVEILTNVDGQELSDPKFRPSLPMAEQLGTSS